MATVELSDNEWRKILGFLNSCSDIYVGQEGDCRLFIEAVLWISRSGAQWRLLPPVYGKWNSVYKRFVRWCEKGLWQQMHEHFADDPDLESIMIDSSVVRAHPCAAGAPQKRGPISPSSGPKSRRIQLQDPCLC